MKKRNWLIQLRTEKRLSQANVANAVNVSRAYYTNIELGKKTPSIEVAKAIADYLDFPWTLFFS